MTTEQKQLVEDAARLLGYDKISVWDDRWNCFTDYEGFAFDPYDPERGDLWKVAMAARLDIDAYEEAVFLPIHLPNSHEGIAFRVGDYQSLATTVLKAARAVLKARGEE